MAEAGRVDWDEDGVEVRGAFDQSGGSAAGVATANFVYDYARPVLAPVTPD